MMPFWCFVMDIRVRITGDLKTSKHLIHHVLIILNRRDPA